MSRLSPFILVPALCLLLIACLQKAPAELPSGEVLRRAVLQTMTLDSVRIEGTASFSTTGRNTRLQATVALTGALAPLRRVWILDFGGTFVVPEKSAFSLRGTMATDGSTDYLTIRDVHSTDPRLIAAISASLLNKWRSLGPPVQGQRISSAPDPRAVDILVSAIHIDSGGLERDANRNYIYRYRVTIDPALTEGAGISGDLVIDAHSFALLSVRWMLKNMQTTFGLADSEIDLRFTDRNAAFMLPTLTGSLLEPDTIFDMISLR